MSNEAGRLTRPVLVGRRGAVAAAHPLAAAAGQRLLDLGGSAVDAAIAAQAALCVLLPNACGLGGDGLALVRDAEGITAVNGTGAAPLAGLPDPLPTDGGGSVTVPGLVAAWGALSARWGRAGLEASLAPAVRLAAEGAPLAASVATAAGQHRARLERGGASGWEITRARAGEVVRQPALARVLQAIATSGPDAFYHGPLAEAIAAAARRDGGRLRADDLAAHETVIAAPLTVGWRDRTVHVQPPVSQAVLLAMTLRWLEEREGPTLPDEHVLVELIKAVFAYRDRAGEGAALLDAPLAVDPERVRQDAGPRAYLHTAGVAAADAEGQVVSSLVTVFDDFGAATFVAEGGFVLTNRGAGFTAPPNDPAPGKRPIHTLSPIMLEEADTAIALATPGADGQVQTLLQVLVALARGLDLPAAIAAPRWRSEDGRLLVERAHPHAHALAARGHRVTAVADGDERFGAVVAAGVRHGVPVATSDWRRDVWAGVA